jgi:hypothetical protein
VSDSDRLSVTSFLDLLDRVREGDPQAQQQLYDLFSPSVLSVIRRHLRHGSNLAVFR